MNSVDILCDNNLMECDGILLTLVTAQKTMKLEMLVVHMILLDLKFGGGN